MNSHPCLACHVIVSRGQIFCLACKAALTDDERREVDIYANPETTFMAMAQHASNAAAKIRERRDIA